MNRITLIDLPVHGHLKIERRDIHDMRISIRIVRIHQIAVCRQSDIVTRRIHGTQIHIAGCGKFYIGINGAVIDCRYNQQIRSSILDIDSLVRSIELHGTHFGINRISSFTDLQCGHFDRFGRNISIDAIAIDDVAVGQQRYGVYRIRTGRIRTGERHRKNPDIVRFNMAKRKIACGRQPELAAGTARNPQITGILDPHITSSLGIE